MKCPFKLEPHQIQGLDFINIFPVIQWLVKKSVQNRSEKADRLHNFSKLQFHNNFQLETEKRMQEKRESMLEYSKVIDANFLPRRHFKKIGNEVLEDKKRVNLTLMEYMDKNLLKASLKVGASSSGESKEDLQIPLNSLQTQETFEEDFESELNEDEKGEIQMHYKSFKLELEDTQGLSKQNKLNTLKATSKALKMRLERLETENQALKKENEEEIEGTLNAIAEKKEEFEQKISLLNQRLEEDETESYKNIQVLITENERLSKEESAFKEACKKELQEMQDKIDNFKPAQDSDIEEYERKLEEYNEMFKQARFQLAKKNRLVLSVQRQLDNIPDNVELSQYQRRILELYNQISVKHKETKQFFALYNTLSDIKVFLEKEIAILNNIHENFEHAQDSAHNKTQFVQKMEELVESLNSNKGKLKKKFDEEKTNRDEFNCQLLSINEDQRKYANTVKQFRKMCQKHEVLRGYLENLEGGVA